MATNHLSQGQHPHAWPWGVAMYTNLHHYHHHGHHHYEKEHLFEKPLTPSDVGKLNRLVIPKQHAERYFPLSSSSAGAGDKGLILCFEDDDDDDNEQAAAANKPWRFRYSYWTSSQSYVLTKGWSRYVKEKQLDAGDVVRFQRMRGFGMPDRLFISHSRRGETTAAATTVPPAAPPPPPPAAAAVRIEQQQQQQPWSPMCYSYSTSGSYPPTSSPANSQHAYHRHSGDHDHSNNMQHAGESQSDRDNRSCSAASAPPPPSRRLRLFGVNLDCGPGPETPTAMYGYMHQSPYASNNWGSPYQHDEEI